MHPSGEGVTNYYLRSLKWSRLMAKEKKKKEKENKTKLKTDLGLTGDSLFRLQALC